MPNFSKIRELAAELLMIKYIFPVRFWGGGFVRPRSHSGVNLPNYTTTTGGLDLIICAPMLVQNVLYVWFID